MSRLRPPHAVAMLSAVVASMTACAAPPPELSPADGGIHRPFGGACAESDHCESRLCVAITAERALCTRACADDADCPGGPSWGCVLPEGSDRRVCGCAPDADEEICGDGVDNECNGEVDDCRMCGGVPVGEESREHCGECFHACRTDQACDEGACACERADTIDCGERCVDPSSDRAHCGRCDSACAPEQQCVEGTCRCPAATPDACGDACVDFAVDPDHCGDCDVACQPGLACVDGSCACVDPTRPDACADAGCVDLDLDPAHCGACETSCRTGEVCRGGTCTCPTAGTEWCAGTCVDVSRDVTNCGACGVACLPGEVCASGDCRCASGVVCGGVCMPESDSRNCGGCGVSCRADQLCDGGACRCRAGAECGGTCVDLATDESSCGACGAQCGTSMTCIGGACRCSAIGLTECPLAGGCVDLRTDESHCGACGATCPAAQSCVGSTCRCPLAGQTYCASRDACVDLANDSQSCGSCGTSCPPGTDCRSGRCECPLAGWVYCSAVGACVDAQRDETNCGACGVTCPDATSCSSGRCACDAAGLTLCGDACLDLANDALHCGSCARACAAGRVCTAGACVCPPLVPATPVRLTTSGDEDGFVRIASNGTHVGVVWGRGGSADSPRENHFAILASDGTPIVPDVLIAAGVYAIGAPDVVWTGAEWGIAWAEYFASDDRWHVMLQRVDAVGVPIGTPIRTTATWASRETPLVLALGWAPGTGYAVIQSAQSYNVYLHLLGVDGTEGGTPVSIPGYYGYRPRIDIAGAADGRFLTLVATALRVINADGTYATATATPTNVHGVRLANQSGLGWSATGTRSVTTGGVSRTEVLLLRGSSLSSISVIDPGTARLFAGTAVAIDASTATFVWKDVSTPAASLLAARARVSGTTTLLSPRQTVLPDTVVSANNDIGAAHVGPARVVVVWSDTRWGQRELYAMSLAVPECS